MDTFIYNFIIILMFIFLIGASIIIGILEDELNKTKKASFTDKLLNVNVRISDLKMFREYSELTGNIIDDERIPHDVKMEYKNKWEIIERKYNNNEV